MTVHVRGDHTRIDGHTFSLGQAFDTKREAQAHAAALRKKGNLCRVTKYNDTGRGRVRYGVYVSSK
jgi:hypothetical protein